MEIGIHHLIKNNPLFASLDAAGIKELTGKLHEIHIPKNKFAYKQGDLSQGLYFLASGKLIITIRTKNKEKKVFAEINPGETFGEIGALSHEPRGASAKALSNSVILILKQNDFFELCGKYPQLLIETMSILQKHTRSLVDVLSAHEPEKKHIALIPANQNTPMQKFSERLKKNLVNFPGVTLLSDHDPELTKKHKTQTELKSLINKLNHQGEKIIYILGLEESHLSKLCLEHVDIMYLVGCGNSKAHLNPFVHEQIKTTKQSYKIKPELILLYEKETHLPHGTSKWLKLLDFNMQHHVRLYKDTDIQRISRFLRSQAVGLVLGGGGVRSWAHIGAIKALEESGTPIDMVCGTSGGAIVAGYYALHETYEDKHGQLCDLTKITHKSISFRHLTWPAVSLFDGEIYTEKQKKIFGNTTIENLWIPFFCVSCNLEKSTAVIHKRGMLWKKIRASTSVPGIFPPVIINGQLHLDGGIVNNLPVDIMKKFYPHISKVIAVELIHTKNGGKDYRFPAILPLSKVILSKLKIKYKDYKFPTFVDTFLKSLLAGSSAKQNENARAADVLVSPDLSAFDLLRLSNNEQSELLELGYQATIKALEKSAKKTSKARKLSAQRAAQKV